MPDNASTDKSQDINHEKPDKPRAIFSSSGLWIIGVVGTILLAGIGSVAYYDVGEKSFRINFMVASTLNLLIFVAILVQAFIYKRQWEAMQDGLDRTDRMIERMEAQEGHLKQSADMAMGQLVAMQHQEQALVAGLEETRKQ